MRLKRVVSITAIFLFFAFQAIEAQAKRNTQITGWNFDWDDNIFFMPTKIMVSHVKSGKEIGLTTGDFAVHRGGIGKSGKFKDYKITNRSFRFFRDPKAQRRNYFKEDVVAAIEKSNTPSWQGPSWDHFVFAMSQRETAAQTTIITARGHSQKSMHQGLKWLQNKGYIKFLPPEENLFGVSHAKFSGDAASPAATKAKLMIKILDNIDKSPIPAASFPVLDSYGKKQKKMHLWGFSDDDHKNFDKAVKVLSSELGKGRWKNTKITVFFTGLHHKKVKPHALVLKRDGSTRKRKLNERDEGVFVEKCLPIARAQ